MKHKTHTRAAVYSAAIIGATLSLTLVALLYANAKASLQANASMTGFPGGVMTNTPAALSDLSITRQAPSSFSWDKPFDVRYVITNNGGRAAQANIVEAYVSASYNTNRKAYVSAPISFQSMIVPNTAMNNRVRCAPGGGLLRCIFPSGIETGETITFDVRYIVPPRSVQCDTTVSLAAATVSTGLIGAYPPRPYEIAQKDANPLNNTAAPLSSRLDCASLTGDLAVSLSGPSTVAKGDSTEFVLTVTNVGSVRSVVPAVQVTFPAVGFDILSTVGIERDGMCVRMSKVDAGNQRTCVNPSIMLDPGAQASYRLTIRSSMNVCTAGIVKAVITADMSMPTPTLTQVYETNVANNIVESGVTCDPSLPSQSPSSQTSTPTNLGTPSSSTVIPTPPTPYGNWQWWQKR